MRHMRAPRRGGDGGRNAMPPRILRRDQPRLQSGNLRHSFGRFARRQGFHGGFGFGEIARTAQRINDADGLLSIQSGTASPQCDRFAPPKPRQIVAIEVIRDPSGMQRCFCGRMQGASFFQHMPPSQKAPGQNRVRRIGNQRAIGCRCHGLRARRMRFRNIGRGIATMRAGLQPARHGGPNRRPRAQIQIGRLFRCGRAKALLAAFMAAYPAALFPPRRCWRRSHYAVRSAPPACSAACAAARRATGTR